MSALHARGPDVIHGAGRVVRSLPAGTMRGAWERRLFRSADECLMDVLVATQALEQHYRDNGRPFLTHCARELEQDVHALLDDIERGYWGWEPV